MSVLYLPPLINSGIAQTLCILPLTDLVLSIYSPRGKLRCVEETLSLSTDAHAVPQVMILTLQQLDVLQDVLFLAMLTGEN